MDGKNKFKISFSLFNVDTGKVEAETTLDAKDYIDKYHDVFNAASGVHSLEEAERLEKSFSTKYLKNTFKSLIDGNVSFWTRIFRDLDVATAPLNMKITMEMQGERPKPIIAKDALTYR